VQGRVSLRQLRALLVVLCVVVLAFGAGPAQAQGREPLPTELWRKYPLDPSSEQGANVSIQAARSFVVPARANPPSSSSDSMLLLGGLALSVLILSDTLFLTLLGRRLRGSA
jgi:hypothetical protein